MTTPSGRLAFRSAARVFLRVVALLALVVVATWGRIWYGTRRISG